MTVALPASGSIEITYDAFGTPDVTTNVLADIIGFYVLGGDHTGPAGPPHLERADDGNPINGPFAFITVRAI